MKELLGAEAMEIVDAAPNMIVLERGLHHSFEPVGHIEKGVRLGLRWLRTTGRNMAADSRYRPSIPMLIPGFVGVVYEANP
jgi:hypothetical protein